MAKQSNVYMKRVESYKESGKLFSAIKEAVEGAGGIPIKNGDSVAIKINMCDARPPHTGTITHPRFLDAFLRYLREAFSNIDISVVESDATVAFADLFIRWFGFVPVLEKWEAQWCNLSNDDVIEESIRGCYLNSVPVSDVLARSHLVSLPKLKTNALTRITGSLKNQFGCLPMKEKNVFHDHLAEVIVDVNSVLMPVFSIIDGIIAVGGPSGPSFGVPVKAKVILASRDPVAIDSAASNVIGIRPRNVKHIRLAEDRGLGSSEYKTNGEELSFPSFELDRFAALQGKIGRKIKGMMRRRVRSGGRTAK